MVRFARIRFYAVWWGGAGGGGGGGGQLCLWYAVTGADACSVIWKDYVYGEIWRFLLAGIWSKCFGLESF